MGGQISSCVEPGPVYSLLQAVRQGDLRAIEYRLELDPLLLTHRVLGTRDTVWHVAAAGDSEEVLATLERFAGPLRDKGLYPAALNLRNDRGQTPLMFAAQSGHVVTLKWLLRRGADPWVADRCGKRSAIHYAAMRGRLECVTALLDSRESTQELYRLMEVRSISGLTPLHYAVAMRQAGAVRLLLERGADLRAVNTIGDAYDLVNVPLRSTPLHVAAMLNDLDCALALLQYYHHHLAGPNFADPRRRVDALGRTPYRVALARGTQSGLLAELLHPSSQLQELFGARDGAGPGEGGAAVVPRLAALAAAAVRQQLLDDIQFAEKVIMDFRRRNPCCSAAPQLMRLQEAALQRPPGLGGPHPSLDPSTAPPRLSVLTCPPLEGARQGQGQREGQGQGQEGRRGLSLERQQSCGRESVRGSERRRSSRRCSRDTPLLLLPMPAPMRCESPACSGPLPATAAPAAVGSSPTVHSRTHSVTAVSCTDSAICTTTSRVPPPAPDPDAEVLATLTAAAVAAAPPPPWSVSDAAAAVGPLPGCCAIRQPSPFVRRSAGYVESMFSRAPLLPVSQCVVCLEEVYGLVAEPCHHRLCGHCLRDLLLRAATMPLPCPVCRLAVCQITSPVC